MPTTSESPGDANPVQLAQAYFDAGRLADALALLRPLDRSPLSAAELTRVASLHCRSAYRVGELAEAAACAHTFLTGVDSSINATLAARFDVLAVAVVACCELALYERGLEHVRELISLSGRLGDLSSWVRARGSAASCFSLMGDHQAGQRLLAELAGAFMGPELEMRLEFTVRGNHASTSLLMARTALAAGDSALAEEALHAAAASIERGHEIAARLQDKRLKAFGDVHGLELALLRGQPPAASQALSDSLAAAEAAGLAAHVRQLRLLQAELQLALCQADAALATLQPLKAALHEGHELSSHIRLHDLLHRAWRDSGQLQAAEAARDEAARWRALRSQRQAQARSCFVQLQLELEHLHHQRPQG